MEEKNRHSWVSIDRVGSDITSWRQGADGRKRSDLVRWDCRSPYGGRAQKNDPQLAGPPCGKAGKSMLKDCRPQNASLEEVVLKLQRAASERCGCGGV